MLILHNMYTRSFLCLGEVITQNAFDKLKKLEVQRIWESHLNKVYQNLMLVLVAKEQKLPPVWSL
jgi:hypothetical protein